MKLSKFREISPCQLVSYLKRQCSSLHAIYQLIDKNTHFAIVGTLDKISTTGGKACLQVS